MKRTVNGFVVPVLIFVLGETGLIWLALIVSVVAGLFVRAVGNKFLFG